MRKYSFASCAASLEIEATEKTFYCNGQTLVARMKRYNDAFYEIVAGKFKGNLVHIWDIV